MRRRRATAPRATAPAVVPAWRMLSSAARCERGLLGAAASRRDACGLRFEHGHLPLEPRTSDARPPRVDPSTKYNTNRSTCLRRGGGDAHELCAPRRASRIARAQVRPVTVSDATAIAGRSAATTERKVSAGSGTDSASIPLSESSVSTGSFKRGRRSTTSTRADSACLAAQHHAIHAVRDD